MSANDFAALKAVVISSNSSRCNTQLSSRAISQVTSHSSSTRTSQIQSPRCERASIPAPQKQAEVRSPVGCNPKNVFAKPELATTTPRCESTETPIVIPDLSVSRIDLMPMEQKRQYINRLKQGIAALSGNTKNTTSDAKPKHIDDAWCADCISEASEAIKRAKRAMERATDLETKARAEAEYKRLVREENERIRAAKETRRAMEEKALVEKAKEREQTTQRMQKENQKYMDEIKKGLETARKASEMEALRRKQAVDDMLEYAKETSEYKQNLAKKEKEFEIACAKLAESGKSKSMYPLEHIITPEDRIKAEQEKIELHKSIVKDLEERAKALKNQKDRETAKEREEISKQLLLTKKAKELAEERERLAREEMVKSYDQENARKRQAANERKKMEEQARLKLEENVKAEMERQKAEEVDRKSLATREAARNIQEANDAKNINEDLLKLLKKAQDLKNERNSALARENMERRKMLGMVECDRCETCTDENLITYLNKDEINLLPADFPRKISHRH